MILASCIVLAVIAGSSIAKATESMPFSTSEPASTLKTSLGIKLVANHKASVRDKSYYALLVGEESIKSESRCYSIMPFLDSQEFASLPSSATAHIAEHPYVQDCLATQYVFQQLDSICPVYEKKNYGYIVYARIWKWKDTFGWPRRTNWQIDTMCLTKSAFDAMPSDIAKSYGDSSFFSTSRLGFDQMKKYVQDNVSDPNLYKVASSSRSF